MKLFQHATVCCTSLIATIVLFSPSIAHAEDTVSISQDLMADCTSDGVSEAACECVIGEISYVTGITEFDLNNIDGAVGDYIEAYEGDEWFLQKLLEDCVTSYP